MRYLESDVDVEKEVIERERVKFLEEASMVLTPREFDVVRRRVIGGESCEKIGSSYGLCRQRIRQIELRGMRLLRKELSPIL